MSEWQPIETAPRDNERFLAWSKDNECFVVARIMRGKLVNSWDHQSLQHHKATHWMPLPEPPK